jgi:hypothetical protein
MSFAKELFETATKANNVIPRLKELMVEESKKGKYKLYINFTDREQNLSSNYEYKNGIIPFNFYRLIYKFCEKEGLRFDNCTSYRKYYIEWEQPKSEQERIEENQIQEIINRVHANIINKNNLSMNKYEQDEENENSENDSETEERYPAGFH